MRPGAILLIGPTGSGKTPLGNLLERKGMRGYQCRHFDFGANLRRVAAVGPEAAVLTPNELEVVRRVLATGVLLRDEEFGIAEKILAEFVQREMPKGLPVWLVLNGLPRHREQAVRIEPLVAVQVVVYLNCPAEVVRERIRMNSGGDRHGRTDDSPEEIARKLDIFVEQTMPLLDYYRGKGMRLVTVEVKPQTTAENMRSRLEAEIVDTPYPFAQHSGFCEPQPTQGARSDGN
ncbi:MAG: nucleoside monophosphate kinase [Kiritimatiellae bacterium]|nr:nucleoside monophosphate kinase [Kiritimatiellia bacterium]